MLPGPAPINRLGADSGEPTPRSGEGGVGADRRTCQVLVTRIGSACPAPGRSSATGGIRRGDGGSAMLLADRKNRAWVVLTGALAVAAVAWYAAECARAGRTLGGGSRPGLAFGVAGGLICLFELLLWPRKALRRWGQTFRMGPTQAWMRAHIWLGLLSVPLLVMHGGIFPWGGPLSTWLMALFLVVIASGVWGLAMQQVLPRRMLEEVPGETIASQIDYVRAQLRGEGARIVYATCRPSGGGAAAEADANGAGPAGADGEALSGFRVPGKARPARARLVPEPVPGSEPLVALFRDKIAPYLCPGPLFEYYRTEPRTRPARPPKATEPRRPPLGDAKVAAMIFEGVRYELDPRAHPAVAALEALCDQRRQFDRQARLQRWLHNWLAVHLPLSVALIVLMLVHAVVALKYL